jgi:hypothetical protein
MAIESSMELFSFNYLVIYSTLLLLLFSPLQFERSEIEIVRTLKPAPVRLFRSVQAQMMSIEGPSRSSEHLQSPQQQLPK